MNFWTLAIIFSVIGIVLPFVVFGFGYYINLIFERKSKVRPELPPQDNAIQAVYDMYVELYIRQLSIFSFQETRNAANIMGDYRPSSSNGTLIEFVRVAHFVGCDVTLRIRSEEDFENDPESTELCVSRQRQEWYAEIHEKQ